MYYNLDLRKMDSPTKILQAVSFLDMFAVGLIIPQIPSHARILGCSPLLIGFMGAVYSGFQLVSGPITGSLSDIKGRKPILILALSFCGTAYMLLGITSSIVLFLTLRAFLGMFKQTQLLTKALAPDYEKDSDKQSVVYGRLATLSGIGMSLGPIISGHIMDAYPNIGFILISLLVGAIFATNSKLIRRLPEQKNEKDKKQSEEVIVASKLIYSVANNFKQSIEEFYKIDWSIYGEVFLFKLMMTLCMGVYFCNYAVFLKVKHQVSAKDLGYIVAFQGAVGSFCTYFIRYVNYFYKDDKDFSKRIYHIFVTVTTSLVGMALASNVTLYVAFLIPLALCGAVGRIISLEMILNKSDSGHRGTVMGATNSVRSLSGVIAPLIAGVVGEYVGIMRVIYVSALFAATGVAVSYNNRSQSIKAAKKKSE